jgi:hypothetical protein
VDFRGPGFDTVCCLFRLVNIRDSGNDSKMWNRSSADAEAHLR